MNDYETQCNSRTEILDIIYPIGAIVFGAVVGDPNKTLGEVWEKLWDDLFKRIE